MAETGSTNEQKRLDYPTNLDVIIYGKGNKEYQVAGSVQTGNFKKDEFLLRDPSNDKILIRVTGAKFKTFIDKKEPESENVYRKDEGVMVTGKLVGGKKEIVKVPQS